MQAVPGAGIYNVQLVRGTGVSVTLRSPKPPRQVRLLGPPLQHAAGAGRPMTMRTYVRDPWSCRSRQGAGASRPPALRPCGRRRLSGHRGGVRERMVLSMPPARPATLRRRGTQAVYVQAGGKLWLHAFPQHGSGRKHERPIVLGSWQEEIVARHPGEFLRGLIHSDGCRTINRFTTTLPSGGVAECACARYFFSSLSADIRGSFCTTCDALGVIGRCPTRATSRSHTARASRCSTLSGVRRIEALRPCRGTAAPSAARRSRRARRPRRARGRCRPRTRRRPSGRARPSRGSTPG